jgi:hypothetical protein
MAITVGLITIDGSTAPTGASSWNPSQYETAVNGLLGQINGRGVGRAVIAAIAQPMSVIPWPNPSECNAQGEPTDWVAWTPAGQPILQCAGAATGAPWQPSGAPVIGSGTGSPARVRFTPGMWGPAGMCAGTATGPGSQRVEVLLHEIVHGMRATVGLLLCQALGLHYDTEEEFVAVTVTNMYMSEAGATQLRASHLGFQPLTSPSRFYCGEAEQRRMIQRIFSQQPNFARALSRVPCRFNPFLEHV